MAFDALATTAFGNDPTAFLERNFVVPRGHTNLHGHTTKVGRNGVAPRDKILSAGIPFGALKLRVSDADTITVTSIGNRNRATAYIGLFELEEGRYEARISLHQAPNAPLKVFYLPSAANQILAVRLPDVGGPSICLTDPLSGCTIFTTTLGNDAWMFHANAHAVRNGAHDPPRRYMRDLFRHFTSASLHQPVKMFDRPMYEPDQAAWVNAWVADKVDRGRDPQEVESYPQSFTVFGVRTAGVWRFYYQKGLVLDSKRTGLKRLLRGRDSHKFKHTFAELPDVPNGGILNP